MFVNWNRRFTKKDEPIWYLFIDESGVPYVRPNDRILVLAGVLTDDPEALASAVTKYPSETVDDADGEMKDFEKWMMPGMSEIKHKTTHDDIHDMLMLDMRNQGVRNFVVVTSKSYSENGEGAETAYANSFKELVRLISNHGPDGVYRIRVDDSKWYDETAFRNITKGNFRNTGKTLARFNGMRSVDSELVPGIQAADILAGEYRSVMHDKELRTRFDEKNNVKHSWRSRKIRDRRKE